MYFKSDLGRWAASSWALSHISSLVLFRHRISELPQPIASETFTHDRYLAVFYNANSWSPPLKKFGGQKQWMVLDYQLTVLLVKVLRTIVFENSQLV